MLAARGEGALRGQAARLLEHVRSAGAALVDVGFSSVVSRAVLEHRAVIPAGDREERVAGLEALAAGEESGRVVRGVAGNGGGTAFLFTGQ
ncbi:KS-MAT linker domain-containing protein, partial [Streptomyces sp. DT17]